MQLLCYIGSICWLVPDRMRCISDTVQWYSRSLARALTLLLQCGVGERMHLYCMQSVVRYSLRSM